MNTSKPQEAVQEKCTNELFDYIQGLMGQHLFPIFMTGLSDQLATMVPIHRRSRGSAKRCDLSEAV